MRVRRPEIRSACRGILHPCRRLPRALPLLALVACQPADRGEADDAAAADDGTPAVEITAKDFEFEAPRTVPSGWVTFRFLNASEEQEHFFLLWQLPEDRTFADYQAEVVRPFLRVWSRYHTGELTREETAAALGEALPDWFFQEVRPRSGAALTEPGLTSQVTLRLEPGTYAVECYVKTPQGTWHSERGMVRELTVTEASGGGSPPPATARLVLSNYEISASGELVAGTNTVEVQATDTPEGFVTHDINLFRLEGETTVEEIVAWMDWMDLDGFRAPGPGISVGGVEHLVAGETAYLTVDLAPGRYAWVSEGYGARGMVEEFVIE